MKRWHMESIVTAHRAPSDPPAVLLIVLGVAILVLAFGVWVGAAP